MILSHLHRVIREHNIVSNIREKWVRKILKKKLIQHHCIAYINRSRTTWKWIRNYYFNWEFDLIYSVTHLKVGCLKKIVSFVQNITKIYFFQFWGNVNIRIFTNARLHPSYLRTSISDTTKLSTIFFYNL